MLQRQGERARLGGKIEERLVGPQDSHQRVRQHGRTFTQQTRPDYCMISSHIEKLQAQKWDPGDQPSPKEMAEKEGELRQSSWQGIQVGD